MSPKARATDRRHGERFEVVGSLPARITVLRRLLASVDSQIQPLIDTANPAIN
jgi:hypothetical protein